MTTTRRARRQAAVTATLGLTLLASGCTGDAEPVAAPVESSQAPSPSPSEPLDEAARLEQRNVEKAEQRILDYWAELGRVGEDAFEGWQDLSDHFTPTLWTSYAEVYGSLAEAGTSTEGAVTVDDMTVVDYEPSESGLERVTVDGCTDWSGLTTLDAGGVAQERPADQPPRYVVRYLVVHTGPDGAWVLSEIDGRQEETC